MRTADSFSASYAEARAKFTAAAQAEGGALDTIAHPERGPDGGALATDVAWFGSRDAEAVLVMISGTHGVEGFCGSGAQVDWLRRGEALKLPAGVAVLMIHAVNPYGFAWLRRVTHESVNLNRNWIDFSGPIPGNPAYTELAAAICPASWTERARAEADAAIQAYIETHGSAAWRQAVSGGQYDHPDGLFYGGAAPSWSRRTQTAVFGEYLSRAGRIGIIDYHTGLGPWGFGEQIVTAPRRSEAFARASRWFGTAVTSPDDGTSTSAPIRGDGLSAAPSLAPHAEVTGLALEYGTRPLDEVLTALRADAWLHAHGDVGSESGRLIKAAMRDAFYGDADDWKGMVVGQSLLAVRQAVSGLHQARMGS